MIVLHRFFNSLWYGRNPLAWLLWPLSLLFRFIVQRRRTAYLKGNKPAFHGELPVIVVGNISVGGTGKTPVTVWLIEQLKLQGYRPGVVSRGYGGKAPNYPFRVSETDSASVTGDEPLMIHLRTGVPVVVDPDRSAAVRCLTDSGEVDVIISDDGLQHYALSRTFELVVVDGQRGFGNRQVMPMGPLREPVTRANTVDAVVVNGPPELAQGLAGLPINRCYSMVLEPGEPVPLNTESTAGTEDVVNGKGATDLIAVAGIGHPQRFFDTLTALGMSHRPVPFPDHYDYTELDLEPYQSGFVITTEKDAVKLRRFGGVHGAYLPVNPHILSLNGSHQPSLIDVIIARLKEFDTHHRHLY